MHGVFVVAYTSIIPDYDPYNERPYSDRIMGEWVTANKVSQDLMLMF